MKKIGVFLLIICLTGLTVFLFVFTRNKKEKDILLQPCTKAEAVIEKVGHGFLEIKMEKEEYVIDLENVKIFDTREETTVQEKLEEGMTISIGYTGILETDSAELCTLWVKIV